jgi:hypothetical protein
MSDPEAHHEEEPAPPPKPPRPARTPTGLSDTSTPLTQLEADELYARQLAEHYNAPSYRPTQRGAQDASQRPPRPKKEMGLKPNELYDKDHSFIDGKSLYLGYLTSR